MSRVQQFFIIFGLLIISNLWHVKLYAQVDPMALSPVDERELLMVDDWTTDEGLPSNYLNKICQTPDGYLWITCYSGLVRYDGRQFHVFSQENTAGLHSNSLGEMLMTADSTLWITTAGGGLVSFKDEAFQTYGLNQGIAKLFKAIYQDKQGRIWAGAAEAGWFYFQNDSFHIVFPPEKLPNYRLSCIIQDGKDKMWFGTEANGLFFWDGKGELVAYKGDEIDENSSIWSLYVDSKGVLWVGTDKGLFYLKDERFVSVDAIKDYTVSLMHTDHYNNFWVATNNGLWVRPPHQNTFTEVEGIGGDNKFVVDLTSDHEGNLWFIRLKGGLSRIKKGKFTNFSPQNGLASNVVNHICEYDNGYLVCFENGDINQIKDGQISKFRTRTNLAGKQVKHLFKDREGNLWISSYIGLIRIEPNGTEKHFHLDNGFPSNLIRTVCQDSYGKIWIGTRDKGLIGFDEHGDYEIINSSHGLEDDLILSLQEGSNRELLVGTSNGGLAIVENGEVRKSYTKKDGMPSNVIFSARTDGKGHIWVASNGGIAYIQDDKIRIFNTKTGLPTNNVYDIREDDQGNLWMSSGAGVIKVKKEELLKKNSQSVYFRLYDSADGLAEPECNPTSKTLYDKGGTLWFPTVDGLSMLHPEKITPNPTAPPVYINEFITDTDTIHHRHKVVLSPDTKHFRFDFAALYFYAPNKVHYKYMLEGFDKNWIDDPEQSTRVTYTNLDPGTYTFRVIASNDEGVWNQEGDAIKFKVAAHFYETLWFPIVSILLIVAITVSTYQARVNNLKKGKEKLELLVNQRTSALKQHNTMLEQQQEEILAQRDEIENQHKMVLKQQQEITSSIQYARRIQGALLPPSNALQSVGLDGFVFFKPRDIVSGDFFWIESLENKILLSAADCTGHGVPGAFMSMLGVTFLNDIVIQRKELSPEKVLDTMREEVKRTLRQESSEEGGSQDGMDISFCVLDKDSLELNYAGAYNSIYVIRDADAPPVEAERMKTMEGIEKVLYEILPNRQPIGVFIKEKPFDKQTVQLYQGDMLYLFSDGYYDQMGGKAGRKLMSRNFKRLVLENAHLPCAQQHIVLEEYLHSWKTYKHKQIDDILVMGVAI